MVAYSGVDHVAEMVNLNTALRAYEANVTAMNAARTMAARALDIGGQG
jgi:flagellar basal-body rod protein FlgC